MKYKIFNWTYKPNGNCPVQAEGYFLNNYFYFRSRNECSTIEFYPDKGAFYLMEDCKRFYVLKNFVNDNYGAGWISKREAYLLILKGLFKFLFKHKNTKNK